MSACPDAEMSQRLSFCEWYCREATGEVVARTALHLMSRAQLRELTALFVIGSALTVAVFFLALWLLPDQPFTAFPFPRFP